MAQDPPKDKLCYIHTMEYYLATTVKGMTSYMQQQEQTSEVFW